MEFVLAFLILFGPLAFMAIGIVIMIRRGSSKLPEDADLGESSATDWYPGSERLVD